MQRNEKTIEKRSKKKFIIISGAVLLLVLCGAGLLFKNELTIYQLNQEIER